MNHINTFLMVNITLRTHHIICMQSFIGKGYSKEFTENFSHILRYLKQNNNQKCIRLVSCCDDICKYCPNRTNNNQCKNELFIKHLDNSYKLICNFSYIKQYSLDEINTIINNNLTINKFNTICNKCQWFGICSKLIKNIL